jgi:hypothetical protein
MDQIGYRSCHRHASRGDCVASLSVVPPPPQGFHLIVIVIILLPSFPPSISPTFLPYRQGEHEPLTSSLPTDGIPKMPWNQWGNRTTLRFDLESL